MAGLAHARLDGRLIAVGSISSVGAWTDVAIGDLASITGTPLPASASIVAIELRETSGSASAFLLLRPSDEEAASAAVALETPASAARALSCNLSDPVSSFAVYGSAQVTVFLV